MNSSFSIKEAFSYGWNTFKKQWKFLVPFFLLITVLAMLASYFEKLNLGGFEVVIGLVRAVVTFFIAAFIIRMSLGMYQGTTFSFKTVQFKSIDAWKYALGSFLFSIPIMVSFGATFVYFLFRLGQSFAGGTSNAVDVFVLFFLCFVLAIFMELVFGFWSLSLFDKNIKIIDAFKHSRKITEGNRLKIFGFLICSIILMILGVMALGFGLLISLPVIVLGKVYIYKKLDGQYHVTQSESEVSPVENSVVHVHTETVSDTEIDADGTAHTETIINIEIQPEETEEPKKETE